MAHTDIATFNGITIRRLHTPDGNKTFGYLTGKLIDGTRDLTDVQQHGNSLISAERRAEPFTVIDRVNGWEIRKVHTIDKRTVLAYAAAKDGASFGYSSLAQARAHAGFIPKKTTETLPKRDHAQNQKGYDPHNVRR